MNDIFNFIIRGCVKDAFEALPIADRVEIYYPLYLSTYESLNKRLILNGLIADRLPLMSKEEFTQFWVRS